MVKAAEMMTRKCGRALLCVVVSIALAIPAVPFSEISVAFADPSADLTSTANDGAQADGTSNAPERINVDVPLGGTVDENGTVSISCGNDTEEGQAAIEEYLQQEEEKDQAAQAAAAADQERMQLSNAVDPAAVYEADQAELAGTVIPEGADPSLSLDEIIIPSDDAASTQEYSTHSLQAAPLANAPDYSMTPVVQDIKKLTLYKTTSGSTPQDYIFMGSDGVIDFSQFYMFVECNRTPSFYAELIGGYFLPYQGDRDKYDFPLYRYVLTLKLPSAPGLPAKTVDIVWGFKQNSPTGLGSISVGGTKGNPNLMPAVNDSTVLASFASVDGYDATRTTAYLNAYKMAPFASAEDIVASGNATPANSPFATKSITELWPIHEADGMKVSMLEADAPNIVRNYVYFADGSHVVQDVTYQQSKGLVASYIANDTGMLYQPNMWLMDSVAQKGIDNIASFIRSKTYDGWFTAWMKTKAASKNVKIPRPIRDHFDQNMHDNAEEVAANLMANIPAWSGTGANKYAWEYIIEEAKTATPKDDWQNPDATEIKLFNLLFLYSYYEALLSFDVGGSEELGARKDANLFLATAFRGGVIAGGCSLVNMTAAVTSTVMLSLSYIENLQSNAFPAMLSRYTGNANPVVLVERIVTRTTDYKSMANWFADYMRTIAYYWEYEPPKVEGISDNDQLKWRGWDQARRFPDQVLYWLTLEPGSQYFASTSMMLFTGPTGLYYNGYEMTEDRQNAFHSKLTARFEPAARYAVNVASIVGISRVNAVCVESFDQLASTFDSGGTYLERQGLWGKTLTNDAYHKKFTEGVAIYNANPTGALAMTVNISLQNKRIFFFGKALNVSGWEYALSHEMAHALDNDVFLGGDRRAGTEDYTDGLLTQSYGAQNYIMNLSWEHAQSADVAANLTRERVMSKEKLDDYYAKMYETLDVLDYAALQAFLRLDKDEQSKVATQLRFDGHNGNSALDTGATAVVLCNRQTVLNEYDGTTATMTTNASVFNDGSKKFETPEEVYDNQIVLKPGVTGKTTWLQANYVADSLAGVWWFPIHNNGNRADSRGFKLLMYQILGREGYDAWANFGRTGGGDLAKLKAITGCDSFKQWQMQTWDEIEAKKDQLGYVSFDALVDKFEAALKTDASKADRNLSQMSNLRWRMYYMMKRVTDDFRNGIYEDHAPVTYIHNLSELQAIAENPYGNYALANDIDASGTGIELSGSLIDGVFYGKLDGQGHRIFTENEMLPYVFNDMKQAYVKDLTIAGGVVTRPSLAATNSEWENISYDVYSHKIYTVDDFLEIPEVLDQQINVFTLMDDLDFSEWSAAHMSAKYVIPGLIAGTAGQYKEFHSDGHTITGLQGASLFEKVAFVDFHNITFKDCSNLQDVNTGESVSLITGQAHKSKFWNLTFKDCALSGKYRVGFVVGNDGQINATGGTGVSSGSEFSRIQVTNSTIENGPAGCYAGFVAGRVSNSDISDVYVQGTLTTRGTACGGVVGAVTRSARLSRCISNVDIARIGAADGLLNGVLLGTIENSSTNPYEPANTRVQSCFGLGSPKAGDGSAAGRLAVLQADAASAYQNCFENAIHEDGFTLTSTAAAGVSWVRTDDQLRAKDSSGNAIQFGDDVPDLRDNKEFYTNLGFSEDWWTFDPTIKAGYPVLKIPDPSDARYDLRYKVDYLSETLTFSGADLDLDITKISNIPYKVQGSGDAPTMTWAEAVDPTPLSQVVASGNVLDLSEVIEHPSFMNDEVAETGSRNVVLSQSLKDSGKLCSYLESFALPAREDNPYAGSLIGIRANSKGTGSIRLTSTSQDEPYKLLEYRKVDAGESGDALEEGSWIPMTSSVTEVQPGTYEVRKKATEFSFKSRPTTVTVEEYDPSLVVFPLTLIANGGSWVEGYAAPSEYNNEEVTVLPGADEIVREGHVFQGWFTNEAGTGEVFDDIPVGSSEPMVLYASWKAEAYSIELDLNEGYLKDPADEVTGRTYGEEVVLPEPTRFGYEFCGWYDNEAFEGDAVEVIAADEQGDRSFWAKWEPLRYAVSFHGGEDADGNLPPDDIDLSPFESYTIESGLTLPGAEVMIWEDHVFAGWFRDEELTDGPVTQIAPGQHGDVAFFAKWAGDAYVISYLLNGGSFAEQPKTIYEVGVDGFQPGDEILLPLDVTRDGYDFEGWFLDEECSGEPVESLILSDRNSVLYAKWSKKPVVEPDPPGPIEPDPDVSNPDELNPVRPPLDISAVSIPSVGTVDLQWVERDHARIVVVRSKMPKQPEDIVLTLPDGVYVKSISKRGVRMLFWLADLVGLAEPSEDEPDIWDIVLRSDGPPVQERNIVLEVVPTDDLQPEPPIEDGDQSQPQPPQQQPTGPVGDDHSGNAGGGNGGASQDQDQGTPLAQTEDDAPSFLLAFSVIACLAAALALFLRRLRVKSR